MNLVQVAVAKNTHTAYSYYCNTMLFVEAQYNANLVTESTILVSQYPRQNLVTILSIAIMFYPKIIVFDI